jgi:hypothetical protein
LFEVIILSKACDCCDWFEKKAVGALYIQARIRRKVSWARLIYKPMRTHGSLCIMLSNRDSTDRVRPDMWKQFTLHVKQSLHLQWTCLKSKISGHLSLPHHLRAPSSRQ